MTMSRVSYREHQPGGQHRVLKSVIRNSRVFDRRHSVLLSRNVGL